MNLRSGALLIAASAALIVACASGGETADPSDSPDEAPVRTTTATTVAENLEETAAEMEEDLGSEDPALSTMTLAAGESKVWERPDESFTVRFSEVDGDSRCPVDVQCIVAGQATVVLHFQASSDQASSGQASGEAGEPESERRVAVPPGRGASVSWSDLHFEVELLPEARSDQPAAERDYRVNLTLRP